MVAFINLLCCGIFSSDDLYDWWKRNEVGCQMFEQQLHDARRPSPLSQPCQIFSALRGSRLEEIGMGDTRRLCFDACVQ